MKSQVIYMRKLRLNILILLGVILLFYKSLFNFESKAQEMVLFPCLLNR